MSKLVARKKGVKRTVSIGKVAPETAEQVEDLDGRIEAIQWLIPLGLQAVAEELQRAVVELAGPLRRPQSSKKCVSPLSDYRNDSTRSPTCLLVDQLIRSPYSTRTLYILAPVFSPTLTRTKYIPVPTGSPAESLPSHVKL